MSTPKLRVVVVGSGPTGFFTADALLKAEKTNESFSGVNIDIVDRLPTPFGLVRGGVAPDHQRIKRVAKQYERIAENPAVRFFGNIHVGVDVTIDELAGAYDAVVLCTGAETDRRLGIPGEDFEGSQTATEFVGWYNGHPNYTSIDFDLDVNTAAVIGQGNVAIDVCRVLAKTKEELKTTDITQASLDALDRGAVRDIYMIGRRGPAQAKFTPTELAELAELEDCDVIVDEADLQLSDADKREIDNDRNRKRNFELLIDLAKKPSRGCLRRLHIRFFQSPVEILGEDGRVVGLKLEKNALSGDAFEQAANGTGEFSSLDCGILLRSVGYRGVRIPGVPFDERRGTIPNLEGRVIDDNKQPLAQLYTAGWIKRGPSGVIGTNKPDAQETVSALIDDIEGGRLEIGGDKSPLRILDSASATRPVSWSDWKTLDGAEVARGEAHGKPREKYTNVDEMLDVIEKGDR